MKKKWIISGHGLPAIIVDADSLDGALNIGRQFNRLYNTGQMLESDEKLKQLQLARYQNIYKIVIKLEKIF